ncbi:hypothetical protein LZ009_08125 [Ramlibacter sp. XY19]|uniref:hypothetical protein n=1 Tax=Ramlibacter paludis TaxID=2908000 RepID=UPI0023DAC261|nr:hypothetical protein [Ramlibacter paludis]MCG2592748.1 hypothetical protein [Ramlibacter paludis]
MFAGHVGVALAIGRVERRVNVGVLALAALGLDLLLWAFVLAGWESVVIPPDFASRHQPQFTFPWSHGMLPAAGWSLLAGAWAYAGLSKPAGRAAVCVAAAVFSHWLLDALVHVPEMPLAGAGSPKVGLALWNAMPVALGLESLVVVAGLWLFLSGAGLSRAKAAGLVGLCGSVLAMTIAGMTVAPPPPSAAAMAASSLGAIVVVVALLAWLGTRRR